MVQTDPLDHAPEIAHALGDVIVAWSHAESVVLALFQSLTRLEYSECATVFYSIPNFEGRIRLVKNVAKSRPKLKDRADALMTALEGLRGLSVTRNSYVHHAWAADAEGSERSPLTTSTEGHPRASKDSQSCGSASACCRLRRRAEVLGDEVRKVFLLHPSTRPFQFPFGPVHRFRTHPRARAPCPPVQGSASLTCSIPVIPPALSAPLPKAAWPGRFKLHP